MRHFSGLIGNWRMLQSSSFLSFPKSISDAWVLADVSKGAADGAGVRMLLCEDAAEMLLCEDAAEMLPCEDGRCCVRMLRRCCRVRECCCTIRYYGRCCVRMLAARSAAADAAV